MPVLVAMTTVLLGMAIGLLVGRLVVAGVLNLTFGSAAAGVALGARASGEL